MASKRFFAQALHADWTLFVAFVTRSSPYLVRSTSRARRSPRWNDGTRLVRSKPDRIARRPRRASACIVFERFARRLFSHFVFGMGRLRTVRVDRWFYRLNSSIGDFVHRVGISMRKKSRSIKWYKMKISIFSFRTRARASIRRFGDARVTKRSGTKMCARCATTRGG